jgi:hypothetical protein
MRVRFPADADFNHRVMKAVLRREPSIDFQSVHAANLVGLNEARSLEEAIRSAITHVRSAGFDVARVEIEPEAVAQPA